MRIKQFLFCGLLGFALDAMAPESVVSHEKSRNLYLADWSCFPCKLSYEDITASRAKCDDIDDLVRDSPLLLQAIRSLDTAFLKWYEMYLNQDIETGGFAHNLQTFGHLFIFLAKIECMLTGKSPNVEAMLADCNIAVKRVFNTNSSFPEHEEIVKSCAKAMRSALILHGAS